MIGRKTRIFLVIVAVLVLALPLAAIWFQNKDQWFPLKDEIAARIVANDPGCAGFENRPLLVTLENQSDETVGWHRYNVEMRRSGYSSVLGSESFEDDKIIQPGDIAEYCVRRPDEAVLEDMSVVRPNPYREYPNELLYSIEMIAAEPLVD